jgi:uncharacterized DUF497 family protein
VDSAGARHYLWEVSLEVEWDPAKAESNLRKHGVSFEEAATLLGDPLSVTLEDPDHGHTEPRFLLLGRAATDRLLIVAIAERGETVRIISARPMTSHERRAYERETER